MAMRSNAANEELSAVVRTQRWTGWVLMSMLIFLAPVLAYGQAVEHVSSGAAPDAKTTASAADQRKLESNYVHSPLSFEPNRGQTDKCVQYISHGAGYSLFLTPSDAVLSLQSPVGKRGKGTEPLVKAAALEMVTLGGNKLAPVSGLNVATSHSNYFIGNDHAKWHADIPNFSRVKYSGIYPGIDLTYYGNQSQLEYDFVVSPGADPRAIKLQFKGMESLHLDPRGELLIDTAAGRVRLDQPIVYQAKADGSHEPIDGKFVLAHDQVHFQIGAYDKNRPLVIDPVIAFSSYLGGSGEENYTLGHIGNYVSGIAVDPRGDAYITGITTSTTDFPLVGTDNAKTPLVANAVYTFVAKFSATGTLVYSTFLGGSVFFSYTSYAAIPGGIAVDSNFNAYVAGYTTTSDYPTYQLAYLPSTYINKATGVMGFVTKLDSTGVLSANGYSTYLYGAVQQVDDEGTDLNGVGGYTYLNAITVDGSGNAYVTGAFGPYMPVTSNSYQNNIDNTVRDEDVSGSGSNYTVQDAAYNAGVFELDQYGQNILYGTYLGGSVNDVGTGIAVSSTGVYLTGWTDSKNFPLAAAGNKVIQEIPGAVRQAFVAKLNPANQNNAQLVYSTYLGGTGGNVKGVMTGDEGHAIAIDQSGNAYVTGSTASTDFPTSSTNPPLQATLSGGTGDIDAFVVKVNPTGTAPLVFSTFLGGGLADSGQGIAVDQESNIYVTGYTYSVPSNLPSTPFPTLTGSLPVLEGLGSTEITGAFLTEYNAANSRMIQSTLFASPTSAGSIVGTGIAVDANGNAYITGETKASDMPTTTGAPQLALHGSSDAFLAKIWPITITDSDNLLPAALNFGDVPLGTTTSPHIVTVTSDEINGITVAASAMQGTNPGNFTLSDGCTGGLGSAGASCEMEVTFKPLNGGQYTAYFTLTFTDAQGIQRVVTVIVNGSGAGLIVSPNPITFAATLIGATSNYGVSITDSTTSAVTITGLTTTGGVFGILPGSSCTPPITLSNGGGCDFVASFTPTTVQGVSTGTLTVTTSVGGVTSTQPVPMSGQGTGLVLSPNPAEFPSAEVGNSASSAVKITATNNSSSALTISSWSLPAGAAFYVSSVSNTCSQPIVLAANSSCLIYLFFAPTSVSTFTSTFTVNASVGSVTSSPTVALTGQGIAPVASVSPLSLSFPNVTVGTSSLVAQTLVTNTGGLPLNFAGFSVPAVSNGFAVAALGAGTTCTQTMTLAAQTSTSDGGSCYIGVIYTPTSGGISASTLTIYDNSGGSAGATQTVSLQGTAAQVTLSPAMLSFPSTQVGTSSAGMVATLTNLSSSTLTLASVTIPANSGYSTGPGTTCTAGSTLAANNGSCVVSVIFTPTTATSPMVSTLTITDNAGEVNGSTQSVTLSGQGTAGSATLTPSTLTFSAGVGVTSAAQQVTLTNSGNAVLTLASNPIALSGTNAGNFAVLSSTSPTDCSKVTSLAIGGSCTLSIVFNPTSIVQASAILSITDNSGGKTGSIQTVALTGNGSGPQVVVSPTSLLFPPTLVGQTSAQQTLTVTNTGNASATLSSLVIPANSGFAISGTGTTCAAGVVLAASNGSCVITVTFSPITATGTTQATLTISGSASMTPLAVSLSGQGETPQAVLSPMQALPFNAVIGGSASQTFVLSNPGNAPLQLSGISINISIAGANAGEFSTPGPYGSTSCEIAATVAAGGSCTINVMFAPTSLGAAAAILSVADNAPSTSPQQVALSGNGTPLPAAAVTLSASVLNFGTPVGTTSAVQTVTLTNTGTATLSAINVGITGSSPGAFTESNNCGTSVLAGAQCTLSVSFTASSITPVTAGIAIADNAASSPQSIALNGTGATFTLTTPSLTGSVQPGATAQFNIAVSSSGSPFNSPVILTATGIPAGATVTFAPASVTPGSNGAISVMSIQTPSLIAAETHLHGGRAAPLLAAVFGLPLLGLLGWRRKHHGGLRPLTVLLLAISTFIPFLIITGCAGGYFTDTPHTSVMTVTGTSGSIQQSITVTLTVQ
jgi:hypothetical protein